ncbi:unnamed protein product [Mytilus coruscus]|uniref:Death domain-containing protein n=1 Tax=Mytilus coruscus TaxID=42192 RepID=A0A6J8BCX4_MYTCO|nr:unnamed protein product [Mytilus coruscus]
MPRGRGIRRTRQQNPYCGVGRGQVRKNPVHKNREQRNQPQQARQEADVPQVEPKVVPQAPILNQGPQIATQIPLTRSIWIMGSSIIAKAEAHTISGFTGHNLGFESLGLSDIWVGMPVEKEGVAKLTTNQETLHRCSRWIVNNMKPIIADNIQIICKDAPKDHQVKLKGSLKIISFTSSEELTSRELENAANVLDELTYFTKVKIICRQNEEDLHDVIIHCTKSCETEQRLSELDDRGHKGHQQELEANIEDFVHTGVDPGYFTNERIEKIAYIIARDWKIIADKLNLSNYDISRIISSEDGLVRQAIRMLEMWRIVDAVVMTSESPLTKMCDISKSLNCHDSLVEWSKEYEKNSNDFILTD